MIPKLYSFKKGIHPSYNKERTSGKPIELLQPKGEIVLPMSQHIGAPCTPIVKKGDHVLVGQVIGEPNGYVSVPIHSSVSGTVKAVEERLVPNGNKVLSVVIERDGLCEEDPALNKPLDYKAMTTQEIIEVVKNAGLVGMGGAGFPTYIKLAPPPGKMIKHVIINGAECEPYLTSDHRVMLEEADRLIDGLRILLHLFPEAKGYIGVEDNKADAIAELKKHIKKEDNIEICTLATKYPQGSEKHLIYAITNREVPSGGLPADVDCMVQNVDSALAIWRAFEKSRPIMRRIVTVSGDGVSNPGNFKVRLGTSYRELLEHAGWDPEKTVKVISGGPMMGMALSSVDVPVLKGTAGILCFTEEAVRVTPESNCIRCNKCVEVCPCVLMPTQLNIASLIGDTEMFVDYNGMDCMECGSCSFICPANRHLVQSIRTAKAAVRTQQSKDKK
ncbi:MAG TPA: electron transport complex subunit RsxC [Epulopiscium sp.]|nr:electron transport complex subunit RsxC [Candidatus Epulonipiscium sp.]